MINHAVAGNQTTMRRTIRCVLQGFLFAVIVSCSAAGLSAAEKAKWQADPTRGKRLSERLCSSCHIVHGDETKHVVAGVPSFRAIKDLPNQRIAGFLIRPHTSMPNMQLTRNEIADIIAYMEKLRQDASGEPDKPDEKKRPKPKYPSAS
ncbi:MAG: c-type cytochrome [Hyphomicrobiaceae bacterium]